MQPIQALIVDDERLARQRVRRLLSAERDVEIAGECASVSEAQQITTKTSVNLLFLDVQMPQQDGFHLLRSLRGDSPPAIIFVTAYEQYAIQAFDSAAIDYLLKPLDAARFRNSVARARMMIAPRPLLGNSSLEAVLVRCGEKTVFVKVRDIDWIETAGNYVRLHVGRETHLLRETLHTFEMKLVATQFARVHRSALVNLDRVAEFQQWFNGDYRVVLKDGQQLRMSRTYRTRVQDFLGRTL